MSLYGANAEEQFFRDLFIGATFTDQLQDRSLPWGKRIVTGNSLLIGAFLVILEQPCD